jgi:uncharacterized protein (DUF1015 family)
MVELRAFSGLRFGSTRVPDLGQVIAPPYDVISPDEQRELLARDPFNIVRIELPLADREDPYTQAADTLERWRADGVLARDPAPSLYLYEVRFSVGGEQRVRRSLMAAVRLTPWEQGEILPHERTMAGPKEDRLRLMRATRVNVSPLWTLYRGEVPALGRAWAWAEARRPEQVAEMDDGSFHRLWRLADPDLVAAIEANFAPLRLVIADGHHRYETALNFRDEVAAAGTLSPDHPANFVLALLDREDDEGLVILPTHRLVRGLGRLDQVDLESDLGSDWHGEYFPLSDNAPPEQMKALLEQLYTKSQTERVLGLVGPDPTVFSILILRNKQLMEERAGDHSEAWRNLEVALLDEGLLNPLLEAAGAEREQAITYERNPYAALQAVLRGEYQLAIFLNATRPDQVVAVAEAGDRMPEKSTYFFPKPPTGLVLHELSD